MSKYPRYDEVFFKGKAWLDSLASGEPSLQIEEKPVMDLHTALKHLRSIAPSLWRLDPDRVGIQVTIGGPDFPTGTGRGPDESGFVTATPVYEQDGVFIPIADLNTHYFVIRPFDSIERNITEALRGMIFVIRQRALEICEDLKKQAHTLEEAHVKTDLF